MKVVWLKRDLRLHDHEALFRAIQSKEKVLMLYLFEPSLQQDIHYSERHFDFIKQSLVELQNELLPYHTQILIVEEEALVVFKKLIELVRGDEFGQVFITDTNPERISKLFEKIIRNI